ncbi:HlyD family efflux transporter periplasmic adaptor subunit [Chryseobacterium gambrini]|uniref:HlyD family efflux transporter periplasmic adaptor subunit n=1 Tax=Chryseobacterium gambrini TaxID=373672 RepID=UPI003D0E4E9E
MENSWLYKTHSIKFIKIVSRFLLIFIFVIFLLLFFLKINDSVDFKEGTIYSDNPQLKINTPNEVKVLNSFIKEGQEVKKGDTLFILENLKTKADYNIANLDVATLKEKIGIINKLIQSAEQKKSSIQQLISIQSNIYSVDRKKAEQEIATLNKKIALASQQSSIINDKHKTDSILYAKGAISRLELIEQKNKRIDDKKSQEDIKSNYTQKSYDYNNLANNFQKTNNDLSQSLIELENQIISYKRDIVEMQSQIDNKRYNLTYITDELGKLIILAPVDGTISNVFNSKQSINIIAKNELLAILAPKQEHFYAKITLPEKDLTYIKNNQQVNLKVDAYNYYKFGAIKGRISYISPSDIEKKFYCIAKLTDYNKAINLKAGYQFRGEVIIEEMRLYQYIIKKLFNKLDDSVNPTQKPKSNTTQDSNTQNTGKV